MMEKLPEGWDNSSLIDSVEILDNLRKPINAIQGEKCFNQYGW